MLTVTEEFRSEKAQPISGRRLLMIKARCDCGSAITTARKRLIDGQVTHCGCSPSVKKADNAWMIGHKYQRLTVVAVCGDDPKRVKCECECGGEYVGRADAVRRGGVKSCGCIRGEALRGRTVTNPNRLAFYASQRTGSLERASELVGKRFGRLYVAMASQIEPGIVTALCDCGASWHGRFNLLTNGAVQSCGCANRENTAARNTKHGLSATPEYETWRGMIRRCYRENAPGFKRYGGRGIRVCDRWRVGESGKSGLVCFIEDMGPRPSPEHSIDREDNDGHYEPGNCRWATLSEQAQNQRPGYRFGDPLRELMDSESVCRLAGLVPD